MAFVLIFLSTFQNVFANESIGISNYHPSQFVERAETPFFYSIGKQLKYGLNIDETAPSLFEESWFNGDLVRVYPSPDNQKVAIVSNRKLYIARLGRQPLLALENVDHYSPDKMIAGKVYYKWPTLQWHPNSRFIYIARDKKQWFISNQTFSEDAILVRIDIDNIGKVEEVIPDFRSNRYFFVGIDNICFNYAPGDGSVIWKCSSENGVSKARSLDATGIHLDNGVVLAGPRFISYEPNIYESAIWMGLYGFSIRQIDNRQDALFHKDAPSTPLLVFNAGGNGKGHRVNGILQSGGSVLPGGRYILLNMVDGQILFDRFSSYYRKLPKSTRVFRNLNNTHYEDFVFSIDNRPGNSFNHYVPALP